jgi:hypothetical protein
VFDQQLVRQSNSGADIQIMIGEEVTTSWRNRCQSRAHGSRCAVPSFFVFPFLLVSATFFEICYPGSRIVGMPRGQLPGWPVGYSTLTGILISLRELRKAAPRRSDGNPAVSDHRELRAAQENETARRIRRGFAQQRRYAACLRRHPDHSAKPEASPMLLQLSDDLDQVSASRGS